MFLYDYMDETTPTIDEPMTYRENLQTKPSQQQDWKRFSKQFFVPLSDNDAKENHMFYYYLHKLADQHIANVEAHQEHDGDGGAYEQELESESILNKESGGRPGCHGVVTIEIRVHIFQLPQQGGQLSIGALECLAWFQLAEHNDAHRPVTGGLHRFFAL